MEGWRHTSSDNPCEWYSTRNCNSVAAWRYEECIERKLLIDNKKKMLQSEVFFLIGKVKFLAYFAYIVFSNSTERYDFGSKSCSHPDKLRLFWPYQLVFFTLKLYILKKKYFLKAFSMFKYGIYQLKCGPLYVY